MLAVEKVQDQAGGLRNDRQRISQAGCTSVIVRAVQGSDAALIQEMHERLSKESIYFRYLGPNKPSIENLQRLCASDGETGTVLVATVEEPDEKVIGIAHYCVDPLDPTTAEPAVIVEDTYQGCGLGKQIMSALCQDAIQSGLETFTTYIEPSNYRVVGLIKGSGLRYESRYSDGLKEIRVWLKRN